MNGSIESRFHLRRWLPVDNISASSTYSFQWERPEASGTESWLHPFELHNSWYQCVSPALDLYYITVRSVKIIRQIISLRHQLRWWASACPAYLLGSAGLQCEIILAISSCVDYSIHELALQMLWPYKFCCCPALLVHLPYLLDKTTDADIRLSLFIW